MEQALSLLRNFFNCNLKIMNLSILSLPGFLTEPFPPPLLPP